MTEYWKSQARKYCQFCQCWYTDNKVSQSFHENGKKHKQNVQTHMSKLSKKSAKEFKQKEKMDEDIKKMEAAAMAAYLKDVQNNADLTSKNINEMLGKPEVSTNKPIATPVNNTTAKKSFVWHEIKNEDNCYYWNTITNETTWDPPDEYLSIANQEKEKLKEKKCEKLKEKQKKEKHKEVKKEVDALLAREKMKELAVKKEPPLSTCSSSFGPTPRSSNPYGSWKTVVTKPPENVDLQLPKTKELPPPPVVVEQEIVQFKEKRVESLGDGPVEFKRRKFNNAKRNMRQKIDDE